KAHGGTSYYYALKVMREALESVNAPEGTPVIFLTDGKPGDNPRHAIFWEVDNYVKHKWPLHTILLGSAVDLDEDRTAEKMASQTGGAFYKAVEPEELIEAFLAICVDVFGYMSVENRNTKAFDPFPLLPDTEQLVYLTMRSAPSGKPGIADVRHAGKPFDKNTNRAVYHFPADAGLESSFEVFNIPSPEKGVWQASINSVTERRLLLGQFPFKVELLRDKLKTEYKVGELMEVALDVTSRSAVVLEAINRNSSVEVRYVEGSPDNEPKKVFNLALKKSEKRPSGRLRYAGRTETVLNEPFSPEFVTLFVTFKLDYEGATWTNTKKASFSVQPRGNIVVEPGYIDFGVLPLPDGTADRDVKFRTGLDSGMKVTSAGGFSGITMDPGMVRPMESRPAIARLTLAASPGVTHPGEMEGTFSFAAVDTAGKPSEVPLEVKIKVFWIEARLPSIIDLGRHHAPAAIDTEEVIQASPADAEGWFMNFGALRNDGGSEISIKAEPDFKNGKIRFSGKTPENASPGTYTGEIEIGFKDCKKTWKCRVTMEIRAPDPAFAKVGEPPKLTQTPDSITGEIGFTVSNVENGKLAWKLEGFETAGGIGIFNPKYDFAVSPIGGWSFDSVSDGTYRASVLFHKYDDLPAGTYNGILRISLTDAGGKQIGTIPYPFTLEVTDE
ncbi:MAG: vWA domain-containing protein, partial [Planctomycetota bacterium]